MKAIIFDLDGVLIDSEKLKAEAWKEILLERGVEGGDLWYLKMFGLPGKELCKLAVKEFSIPLTAEQMFQKKREIYFRLSNKKTMPIVSSVRFLKTISKGDFKIGLASSEYKKIIVEHLKRIGIQGLFDVITSGADEVQFGKPNPEIYLLTARKLEVRPEECVAIEDSNAGIQSAKSAGMKCVGYQNPDIKTSKLVGADLVTSDLSTLDVKTFYN